MRSTPRAHARRPPLDDDDDPDSVERIVADLATWTDRAVEAYHDARGRLRYRFVDLGLVTPASVAAALAAADRERQAVLTQLLAGADNEQTPYGQVVVALARLIRDHGVDRVKSGVRFLAALHGHED